MKKTRVLLTGGGTGGHVFPLVAVARVLKKKGVEVAFLGPEEFPLDALREEGVKVETIVQAGKFRRYFSLKTVGEVARMPKAFWQARKFIKTWHPHIILGKGGYGSIAPIIAAHRQHIPVVLHESDVLPGLANRWLSRYADHIALSFAETKKYFPSQQTAITGNPVRTNFSKITKKEARKIFKITARRKFIFIVGGSQGAFSLNELAKRMAPDLLKKYGLIISAGPKNTKEFREIKNQKIVIIRPTLNEEELAAAYTFSDLVVTRAGSGGIFEASLFAKPSIVIPLSTSAGGHQSINAQIYEKTGACIVLDEKNASDKEFLLAVESVLENPERVSVMSGAAKKFSRPLAAGKVADLLLNLARDRFWAHITKKV